MNANALGHSRNASPSRSWSNHAVVAECSSSGCSNCMKLPEKQPLTLSQVPTPQLRSLAAFSDLNSADADRPALLKSLTSELSREAKQQWVIQDAEVSTDPFCDAYAQLSTAALKLQSGPAVIEQSCSNSHKGTFMLSLLVHFASSSWTHCAMWVSS